MESLRSSDDFRELLSIFNAEQVKYLVIGGFALAYYGFPRYTKDLDVWVDPEPQNAERVFRSLAKFGAALGETTSRDFSDPDCVFQIGVEPVRVDILNDISGITFEAAWPNRVAATYGDVAVYVISRSDYVRNKKASGRPSDLRDLAVLDDDTGPPV